MSTLFRGVEVDGVVVDVRVVDDRVAELGSLEPGPADQVVDGRGGALLPGLHDHHIHLLALAASRSSVDVSEDLEPLAQASGTGWLRAVGWRGDGDRHAIDAVVGDRPVRVQHRGGSLWVLSTAAVRELRIDDSAHPGVERDERGDVTGRLWRADDLIAERLGRQDPGVAALAAELAGFGLTGFTDATPDLDVPTCELLHREVPQRLLLLGDPHTTGPWKLVLPDHDLPSLDALVEQIHGVRPRPVAVHCVTRQGLVLLMVALDVAGRRPGDRVEHGAVIPPKLVAALPTVVTQPAFIAARGDDYLHEVDPADLPDLYRYASLLEGGCQVVASSDAPYGPVDPWAVMRAARDRQTPSSTVLGPAEAVSPTVVLDGLLRPLEDLTAAARQVAPGAFADVVLLHAPLEAVLEDPDAGAVRATWVAGEVRAGQETL